MKDGFCKRDPACWKDHLERWKSLLDAPPEPRFEATRVSLPNGVTSTGWKLDVVFPEPPIAKDRSATRFDVSGAAPSHVSHGVHDAGPFVATLVLESDQVPAGRVELRAWGADGVLASIPLELSPAR